MTPFKYPYCCNASKQAHTKNSFSILPGTPATTADYNGRRRYIEQDIARMLRFLQLLAPASKRLWTKPGRVGSCLTLRNGLGPAYIKLDPALIQGLQRDDCKAMIPAMILEAADGLDFSSVAEGIETDAEARWAVDHGTRQLQGCYVARPVPEPWPRIPAVTNLSG